MADVSINTVNAYFNDIAKLNPKLDKIKDQLAADIVSGGGIDKDELEAETVAFKAKGGTEAEFGTLMNNVLGIKDVSTSGFSPTSITFGTKAGKTVAYNDKNPDFNKTEVKPEVKEPEKNFNYNTPESKDITTSIKSVPRTAVKETGLSVQYNPKTKVTYMATQDKGKLEGVKALQKELGVKVDGYIGPQTLKNLVEQHKTALESGDSTKAAKLEEMVHNLGLDKAFEGQKVLGENLSTLFNSTVKADPENVTTETTGVSDNITPRESDEVPANPNAGAASNTVIPPTTPENGKVIPTPQPSPTPETQGNNKIDNPEKLKSAMNEVLNSKPMNNEKLDETIKSAKSNGITDNQFKENFSGLPLPEKIKVYNCLQKNGINVEFNTEDKNKIIAIINYSFSNAIKKSNVDEVRSDFNDGTKLLSLLNKEDAIKVVQDTLNKLSSSDCPNKEEKVIIFNTLLTSAKNR